MAHFVKLDENNIVVDYIVVANEDCNGGNFPESEPYGQQFIASLGIEGRWVQASYNNNFRARYPGYESYYDENLDVFLDKKPHESFILDDTYNWIPPTPKPDDINNWMWDFDNDEWILVEEIV